MIIGSGASAFVVELDREVVARGMEPLADLVLTRYSNAAFHGTRLDGGFISQMMSDVVGEIEQLTGLDRATFARRAFFMSHETYTPARGGSSAAEIEASDLVGVGLDGGVEP